VGQTVFAFLYQRERVGVEEIRGVTSLRIRTISEQEFILRLRT
jgi:hypothetical protein